MVEVEEFENPTPKDVVKNRDVFVYARVSGEDQKENSLPAQIEAVKGTLKALGYRKSLRGRIFEEQASGTTLERPELAKAIQAIREHGKPAVLVVRDIQRFSRDPYGLGVLYRPLWEQDIPVAAFTENLVLGTRKNPSPNADLLAPILVAAGGSEVNLRKKQSTTGVAKAKAKGKAKAKIKQQKRLRGAGDVVAMVTKRAGMRQCGGCRKRQHWLNKLIPFKGARHG